MTKIKICGITNLDDARIAVEAGADALGFNFCEASPRYIAPDAANDIIGKLPKGIWNVGVFVNSGVPVIEQALIRTSVTYVQLHGDETSEFVETLRSRTGACVIKSFRVSPDFNPESAREYNV